MVKFFYRLSFINGLLTGVLLVYGSLVRLMKAGLACPDWPLCYGQLVPEFGFGVLYEVGHRYLATVVGFLSLVLVVICFFDKRLLKVRQLALFILLLIVVQGVFGGLTVLLGLAVWTVVVHLLLGNLSLWLMVILILRAKDLKNMLPAGTISGQSSPKRGLANVIGLNLLFLVLLASGGLNSSTMSGYVCSAFPLCEAGSWGIYFRDGRLLFGGALDFLGSDFNWQKLIHLGHRAVAILFIGYSLAVTCWIYIRERQALKNYYFKGLLTLCILVLIELAVGISNALLAVPVAVSLLHSLLATLITVTLSIMWYKQVSSSTVSN